MKSNTTKLAVNLGLKIEISYEKNYEIEKSSVVGKLPKQKTDFHIYV